MAPALYLQIKQHILDGIRERHYQAGDRIPTEAALCDQFAVSRMTVNKALRELVAEGWLVRTAGSGSFVADRRAESPLLAIRNIADEIRERGSQYSARVIRLQRQAADEKVAVRLGLRVGAPTFHSLIVHEADGEPLQLEERFVDAERLPGYGEQDFTQQTPNSYLMEVCPLSEMEHVVEAVLPSAGEAGLLQVRVDTPCLLLHRRTWSDGYLVSYARLLSPGSRYKLSSKTRLI
ncbi:histidine utilization repressor [Aeromonas encheleia]|uniref:Histidine utilization repressor n=1 Tax=Aeromonas encheleia TaxID=73010 RepID=A0AAE9MHK2_9GAMM|nr:MULTISPECIES: histidine utilization repressor [Aeromonas]MBV7414325.1 histidine utilization repressor [Aeromonas sp. sif2433]MBV7439458.1 histidine utilization repressor [Aeromonas sp. sif2416]USV57882.1 histidine utilization repressor [Aeromonas encheleia]VEG94816.1 histidine utilization repressor [Aeromonas encheleia]